VSIGSQWSQFWPVVCLTRGRTDPSIKGHIQVKKNVNGPYASPKVRNEFVRDFLNLHFLNLQQLNYIVGSQGCFWYMYGFFLKQYSSFGSFQLLHVLFAAFVVVERIKCAAFIWFRFLGKRFIAFLKVCGLLGRQE